MTKNRIQLNVLLVSIIIILFMVGIGERNRAKIQFLCWNEGTHSLYAVDSDDNRIEIAEGKLINDASDLVKMCD